METPIKRFIELAEKLENERDKNLLQSSKTKAKRKALIEYLTVLINDLTAQEINEAFDEIMN